MCSVPICNTIPVTYINTGDANYAALVASVLSAKATGATVSLQSDFDGTGQCQLYYLDVL